MNLLHTTIFGAVLGLTSGAGVLPQDSVNAAVGDDVMFTTILGPNQTQLTSILWQFGSKIITSSANFTAEEYEGRVTLFTSNGYLELRNVTLGDSGGYFVTITTVNGEANGTTTLTVWERISAAVVTSSTQLPAEATSLNLTCDASGPISNREWMKNDLPLNPSDNIIFYNQNQVLSFQSLSRGDSGRYKCIISNPSSSQEATYYMNVIYGPENVEISGPNEVQAQAEFKLSCSAESVPASSYIWIKNGTTVAHSSEFRKNLSEISDSGDYVCQANNDLSLKTSNATHKVLITEVPKSPLSAGAIAGIIIACLVAVAGAAVGGFFLYKHYSGKQESTNRVQRSAATNTTRTNNLPGKKSDSPRSSRGSNFYTDESVYENTAPIYDRDL